MPHPRTAHLVGSYTALITPFDSEGRPLLQYLPDLLAFQREAGIDGIVANGTNGEATALSVAERKQVLETVMTHSNGLKVIAGTGATSLTDALELTRHAAEVGAEAALALPPFFVKNPARQGLEKYFRALLESADIPFLLYSIPQFTAVPITPELLDALKGHPNMCGLKDSAGDLAHTAALLEGYPDLSVFPGSDYLLGACFRAGAHGCISGGANAFPELIAGVSKAWAQSPESDATDIAQERVTAMTHIARRYPPIAVNKSILSLRGFPKFFVRPSLIDLSEAQEASLAQELREAGFLS